MRLRRSVFGALIALAGCGGTPAARTLVALETPAAGDLPPALPGGPAVSDHAETGRAARVVLGERREQVLSLYHRYVHALEARSGDELREIFADPLINLDSGDSEPRDASLQWHEQLMQNADTSQLAATLNAEQVRLRSVPEYHRDGRAVPTAMRVGDWMIERPLPASMRISRLGGNFASFIPLRFLVRWVGERPMIVGASERGRGR